MVMLLWNTTHKDVLIIETIKTASITLSGFVRKKRSGLGTALFFERVIFASFPQKTKPAIMLSQNIAANKFESLGVDSLTMLVIIAELMAEIKKDAMEFKIKYFRFITIHHLHLWLEFT